TMITPFLAMLTTSLKPEAFVLEARPNLLPTEISFDSYEELARRVDLPRAFFNSFMVAGLATVGQVLVSAMAAFAFARMQWRGRNIVFLLYLATMMIPGIVLVIPQFLLVRSLGWINSYAALILPSLFSAFGTFLLRQSFLSLPKDFEEAAVVDGANYFTIFWRIVLPLSGPALATLSVFSFMGLWNSYLWPLFVARRDDVMTLPVALSFLQAETRGVTEWNIVMAGSVVAVLPILIAYIFAQRWFVSGVVVSGIKG
ncbi:MAG: carbohydrate ABC transporter permease, partial [Anaerolineae bacterium]|nr:carbohydrate ABC transporter permease [Anaerolineae bacterium]